jgi:hypothetical protein
MDNRFVIQSIWIQSLKLIITFALFVAFAGCQAQYASNEIAPEIEAVADASVGDAPHRESVHP